MNVASATEVVVISVGFQDVAPVSLVKYAVALALSVLSTIQSPFANQLP
jgi:hypothetical protein